MTTLIHDFVPYDEMPAWQIHDAYYVARGIKAWTASDIPYRSSNNYAMARQHAQLVISQVAILTSRGELTADEPVRVLEVGSGLGEFAAHFLLALSEFTGEEGRALLDRLVYLMSDYSAPTVAQSAERPALAPWVEQGKILPCRYDLRHPKELVDLHENPVAGPVHVVVANYICCITRTKQIRRGEDGWWELYACMSHKDDSSEAASLDFDALVEHWSSQAANTEIFRSIAFQYEWRRIDPQTVLDQERHPRLLESLFPKPSVQPLLYPYGFLDFLIESRPLLAPEAIILINDFATTEWSAKLTDHARQPTLYGNSFNHAVDFEVFEVLCQHHKFGRLQTTDRMASVQTLVLSPRPELSPELVRRFEELYIESHAAQDLTTFSTAAKKSSMLKDHRTAARLYRRCGKLDPTNRTVRFRGAEACIASRWYRAAIELLEEGVKLPARDGLKLDFAQLLGKTHAEIGNYEQALHWYQESLRKTIRPQTYMSLGEIYEAMDDPLEALTYYEKAYMLDRSLEGLEEKLDRLR